jgi:Ca2+-binding EF-hand superfamily protein
MKALHFIAIAFSLLLIPSRGKAAAPPAGQNSSEAVQDVLVLGEGSPLIVRLHLYQDGKPFLARWKTHLTCLFHHLDRDGDGVLDKTEAARAPSAMQMQLQMQGNPYIYPNSQTMPFEKLDANSDGKVSLDEFIRCYHAAGVGAIAVTPTYSYANPLSGEALTNALFKALDADQDGALSRSELMRAEIKLLRLDLDDDEMITPQELQAAFPATTPAQVRSRRRSRMAPPGAASYSTQLFLVDGKKLGGRMGGRLRLAEELLRRYDKDQDGKLSRSEFPVPHKEFEKLDLNHDGYLSFMELLRWTFNPPTVEMVVRLGKADRGEVGLETVEGKNRFAAVHSLSDNTLTFPIGASRYTVRRSVAKAPYGNNYRDFLIRQYQELDNKNKNRGYLTVDDVKKPQYAFMRGILEVSNRKGDGHYTKEEMKAYLNLVQQGAGCQVSLSLHETGKGLFQLLDADGDGRLSVREIRNAWVRLKEYAREGEEKVTKADIPRQVLFTIAQGPQVNPPYIAGYYNGPSAPPLSMQGPLWFRKMDRNGDGDVSRAEFLGSDKDFEKIDTDGDGLISVEEARKADAWFRERQKAKE